MNRVNQSTTTTSRVKMLLVNGTDKLNFQTLTEATGANGPCGATRLLRRGRHGAAAAAVIDTQHRLVLGQLIGAENYDVGHIGFGPSGTAAASPTSPRSA